MRYALSLSYNGAPFSGWQIQNGAPTVQETLEHALSTLLRTAVAVTGAGRTDAGVHAADYLAHFDAPDGAVADPVLLACKLNAILPRSVVVHSVVPVPPEFHARFDARRREYTYFLHRRKDPFMDAFSWLCGYPGLDFEAMNAACAHLLGTHDFSCFEKTGGNSKTSICTVCEAFWAPYIPTHLAVMAYGSATPDRCREGVAGEIAGEAASMAADGAAGTAGEMASGAAGAATGRAKDGACGYVTDSREPEYWYFRISADRFLRNMVRAVTGTLIDIGRGKHDPAWIADLMATGTRSDAGESVPGHALFLSKVRY